MDIENRINAFLDGAPHAVVGATTVRSKYGNKVLRAYQQNDRPVHAINPRGGEIEGLQAFVSLSGMPEVPHGISIITPPKITEAVMREAVELGIKHAWMQPGAESAEAIRIGEEGGMNVIGDGSCLLVMLGYTELA